MKRESTPGRRRLRPIAILSPAMAFLLFIVSGCAAVRVGGQIQQGRKQLLYGDPKLALTHFQRAAEMDPDYVLNFSLLYQSVDTYVGRAYYDSGNLPQARKTLEGAARRHEHDHMAKLYLGLALAREGAREEGARRIEASLRGFTDWFDRIERYNPDGRFWDPGGQLRKEMRRDLAMISGKDINWGELIASGEQLGKKLEDEVDFVRRERWLDEMDSDNNDGSIP